MSVALHVPRTATDEGVIEAAKAALGDSIVDVQEHVGEITVIVKRDEIINVLRGLRDTPGLEYQQLMDIVGVDYPERAERFEVVYHLHSLERNQRIRLKCRLSGINPEIDSVTSVWRSANWYEREVFDMFGIGFRNHPNLVRILMPTDWEGYPLRKDYPVHGYKYSYPSE